MQQCASAQHQGAFPSPRYHSNAQYRRRNRPVGRALEGAGLHHGVDVPVGLHPQRLLPPPHLCQQVCSHSRHPGKSTFVFHQSSLCHKALCALQGMRCRSTRRGGLALQQWAPELAPALLSMPWHRAEDLGLAHGQPGMYVVHARAGTHLRCCRCPGSARRSRRSRARSARACAGPPAPRRPPCAPAGTRAARARCTSRARLPTRQNKGLPQSCCTARAAAPCLRFFHLAPLPCTGLPSVPAVCLLCARCVSVRQVTAVRHHRVPGNTARQQVHAQQSSGHQPCRDKCMLSASLLKF